MSGATNKEQGRLTALMLAAVVLTSLLLVGVRQWGWDQSSATDGVAERRTLESGIPSAHRARSELRGINPQDRLEAVPTRQSAGFVANLSAAPTSHDEQSTQTVHTESRVVTMETMETDSPSASSEWEPAPQKPEAESSKAITTIEGSVVLDASGDPVPDALVVLSAQSLAGSSSRLRKEATTDRDGTFRMVVEGGSLVGALRATRGQSGAMTPLRLGAREKIHRVTLRLNPLVVLKGLVVADPDEMPIAKARVTATSRDGSGAVVDIYADERGFFSLSTTPGSQLIEAMHPEDESWRTTSGMIVEPAAQTEPLVLRLPSGASLKGVVVDSETGEAIPDARIRINADVNASRAVWSALTRSVKSNGDGAFEVPHLSPRAPFHLTAEKLGYQPELRRGLWLSDGIQTFRLRKTSGASAHVQWSDGTPVADFAWKLLRPVSQNIFDDTGIGGKVVDSPDGSAQLGDLGPGQWRLEVSVLSGLGQGTDVREAVAFEIRPGETGKSILVQMGGGTTLRGVVVLDDRNGPRVPFPKVAIHRPVYTHFSPGVAREPQTIPNPVGNESGEFAIEGLPPGEYIIDVSKGDLVPDGPITVTIKSGESLRSMTVVIHAGGTIHGRAVKKDGDPWGGMYVVYSIPDPAGTGWLRRTATTDADGMYEITGLWGGVFSLSAQYNNGTVDSRRVVLEPGGRQKVDFDFSSNATVTGLLSINGEPVEEQSRYTAHFANAIVRQRGIIPPFKDGQYSIELPPGKYRVGFVTPLGPAPVDDTLVIEEGQKEVHKDLNINLVDAEIVAQFPEGAEFAPGTVIIAPRTSHVRGMFLTTQMAQERRYLQNMTQAEFQVTFVSADGKWEGESEWMRLGKGLENRFRVDVRPRNAGTIVYTWGFGDLKNSNVPVTVDVTQLIASKGTLRATVRYERGRHAVTIESAELLENGNRLSIDQHDGWSGVDHSGVTYRLPITSYESGRRYELRMMMGADGGTESVGNVFAEFIPER